MMKRNSRITKDEEGNSSQAYYLFKLNSLSLKVKKKPELYHVTTLLKDLKYPLTVEEYCSYIKDGDLRNKIYHMKKGEMVWKRMIPLQNKKKHLKMKAFLMTVVMIFVLTMIVLSL